MAKQSIAFEPSSKGDAVSNKKKFRYDYDNDQYDVRCCDGEITDPSDNDCPLQKLEPEMGKNTNCADHMFIRVLISLSPDIDNISAFKAHYSL